MLHYKIYSNLYKDSVSLMQISSRLNGLEGVHQASVAMATEANLDRMRDAGMAISVAAKPSDLLIALLTDEAIGQQALALADELLRPAPVDDAPGAVGQRPATSLAMGKERDRDANLALISVPGRYAAAEALKALHLGMNVMLFSDNVPEAQELAIKEFAARQDLLVMGPDCGTAIVNGMPLGFANVVRRGTIGLVAASGTGLQEVSCRIHHLGEGVSQALGTGGRDLHEEIGGLSMQQAIRMLAADPDTRLITLISKPPAEAVSQQVLALARECDKPVVVHFLGADCAALAAQGVIPADSLQHAADVAVAILRDEPLPSSTSFDDAALDQAQSTLGAMAPGQRDIRGIFAGGTFCYEAQLTLIAAGLACESNAPVKGASALQDPARGYGHSLVDMGDDEFTQGRPHPMIDPTLRNARLLQEAADPATAILLFDVVLGYGASLDPTGELLATLARARHEAEQTGRQLIAIAHVCGTELDPQPRQQQIDRLREAGVLIAQSNMQAAQLAARLALQLK
ncbi:acyl-CoA synthetase FdrA [Aeromonas enteropelogenes]|uniref:acyl-CoA synthetase FdrA n=1 Tax=Aeromonas enteropelogenes TaxID=29489 RepID=UPI003B9E5B89